VTKFSNFLNDYYLKLPNVVSVYIDIICLFITNIRNSTMAQVVATSLVQLVQIIGSKLQVQEWDSFTSSLCLCFEVTLPKGLFDKQPQNLDHLFTQSIVQLQLIKCAQQTLSLYFSFFQEANIHQILKSLDISHSLFKDFNQNIEVRKNVWKLGFMKNMKSLPGLIKNQYLSLATMI